MNQKSQQKFNQIVDLIYAFKPLSLRLVLSRRAAKGNSGKVPFIRGANNATFEELDQKFFEIMRDQTELTIPDLSKSSLFSGLNLGGCAAFFYAIRTEFGYAGFIWLILRDSPANATISAMTTTLCDWIVDEISSVHRDEKTTRILANSYVEFLDHLNAPALLYIPASSITATNATFESYSEKKAFFSAFREKVRSNHDFTQLAADFNFRLLNIVLPDEKNGSLFVFATDPRQNALTRFNTNELEYYQVMAQKIRSDLALLESVETLSSAQSTPFTKAKNDLNRLMQIFKLNQSHYQNFQQPSEGAMQRTNIADLLHAVVSDLQNPASAKQLKIACEIERIESAPVQNGEIIGDPWLLTLTIYNLLDNAIRYSKPNAETIEVDLSFSRDNWILVIRDHGAGISTVDLEAIRSEDLSANPENQRINGIDFVKYALRLHHGNLDVQSRLGEGTTVTLTVPIYN